MKRILALFLALMLLFSFAACSNDADDDRDDRPSKSQNKDKDKDNNKDDAPTVTDPAGTNAPGEDTDYGEITFEKTVVAENDICSITVTGIDPDSMWGYTLKVQMENKSDQTYTFSAERASVNGVETTVFLYEQIAAGKKSNGEISFYSDELAEYGITEFTDIELNFRVYDSEDFEAEDVLNEIVHVYPYGEDKATKFERKPEASDVTLVDNEDVTVIVTGYEAPKEDFYGYIVHLYVVNNSDKNLQITTQETSVNGIMLDPYFLSDVPSGKCKFDTIYWSVDELEENDITDVEEIEFILSVSDSDDFWADDLVSEEIVLKP